MKTLTLALTTLTLALTAGPATAATSGPLSFDRMSASMASSNLSSAASAFAQVGATSHSPLSSGMALTLVAVFALTLRLVGLNRARALADHERDSYQGKAQMFRSLHAERATRR